MHQNVNRRNYLLTEHVLRKKSISRVHSLISALNECVNYPTIFSKTDTLGIEGSSLTLSCILNNKFSDWVFYTWDLPGDFIALKVGMDDIIEYYEKS